MYRVKLALGGEFKLSVDPEFKGGTQGVTFEPGLQEQKDLAMQSHGAEVAAR